MAFVYSVFSFDLFQHDCSLAFDEFVEALLLVLTCGITTHLIAWRSFNLTMMDVLISQLPRFVINRKIASTLIWLLPQPISVLCMSPIQSLIFPTLCHCDPCSLASHGEIDCAIVVKSKKGLYMSILHYRCRAGLASFQRIPGLSLRVIEVATPVASHSNSLRL
jgi:hypothetical protein